MHLPITEFLVYTKSFTNEEEPSGGGTRIDLNLQSIKGRIDAHSVMTLRLNLKYGYINISMVDLIKLRTLDQFIAVKTSGLTLLCNRPTSQQRRPSTMNFF